jgi:hypothetical protein
MGHIAAGLLAKACTARVEHRVAIPVRSPSILKEKNRLKQSNYLKTLKQGDKKEEKRHEKRKKKRERITAASPGLYCSC